MSDDLAVCLDVDGTVYPRGSAFVKAAVLLPWYVEEGDAAALRDGLVAVARYSRGETAARRAARMARAFDVLQRLTGRASAGLVAGLVDRAFAEGGDGGFDDVGTAGGDGASPASLDDATPDGYAAMREAVLGRYGDFLAGRRVSDVEAAVARVVSRHLAVDGGWARLIDWLRAAGATVHLVTDAPAHVARAYARKLGADPEAVHGTGYPAADGRYTGAFDPVDKGAVAAAARPADGRLVAAGDSAVDLRMRASADLFFAVAGEGDVAAALAGLDPAPVTVDDFCAAPRVGPPPGPVVLVDDARAGAAAVERALVAAGLVEPPTP